MIQYASLFNEDTAIDKGTPPSHCRFCCVDIFKEMMLELVPLICIGNITMSTGMVRYTE